MQFRVYRVGTWARCPLDNTLSVIRRFGGDDRLMFAVWCCDDGDVVIGG